MVDRDFRPQASNLTWSADITYISTWEGLLYLAHVQDLFSRLIVGWSMADHLRSELVVDALEMALVQVRPMPGPVVALPSDAGTCTGYGRSSGGGELDRELDHHVLLAATSRRRPDFRLRVRTLPARVRGRPTRFEESSDGRAGS